MAKMYTLDGKLLTEKPEIRIGDKVYPIDDRTPVVKKLLKTIKNIDQDDDSVIDTDELIIKAAFNKNAKEILGMDLPYSVQMDISQKALALMTGEEIEEIKKDRFQDEKTKTE